MAHVEALGQENQLIPLGSDSDSGNTHIQSLILVNISS